ncbi:MAG TPA: hypothetical protein VFT12_02125, partial [Thermoanaerobaculia bacterium]|nr:hypothetical protein [Thermoanaerobaculia bacterium]
AARATSPEGVVKIDLNTGATLERYIGKKPTTDLYGIEVVNGWRASLQGVTEVPTLHSAMTLLLGLALTTVVFFRIAR